MSDFVLKNRSYIVLALIIGLAAFLILFHLDQADIQTDDATYSLRALGYLDFMDSDLQTTPVDWFTEIPWWSKFSFHDAPPLVFLLQHLFFKLFGSSVLVARLPFALAGIISVVLIYLIGQRLYNVQAGLLASFLLAISTYHTWASRVGYLEPIALVFSLLTIFWFLKGLENNKNFIWFGVSLGLMMLTKYTTFFFLPVVFFYLLFKNRKIFISRYFIFSLLIAGLFFSPVIFYNLKLFQTRGHFDLQFATLLGQDTTKDWPSLSGDAQPFEFSRFFSPLIDSLSLHSLPIYLLMSAALIYVFVRFIWRFKTSKHFLLVLILLFLIIEFNFIGSSARFLALLTPFYALALSVLLLDIYRYFVKINQSKSTGGILALAFFILIVGFEGFYNFNTNNLIRPIGQKNKHYAGVLRWGSNDTFNQLESYLINEDNLRDEKILKIKGKEDLKINLLEESRDKNVFIYDPNLNWFSTLWYLRRWSIYYHKIFVSAKDLSLVLSGIDWIDYFKNQAGAKNMYFIWGRQKALFDAGYSDAETQTSARNFAAAFAAESQSSVDIKDQNGEVAFTIYKISLNQ